MEDRDASAVPRARPYRVLCLDGGGIRGIYTAALFLRLGALFHRDAEGKPIQLDIGRGFDLVCGTSTGSILAASLAVGLGLEEVVDLYQTAGPRIFPKPMPDMAGWNWKSPMSWWSNRQKLFWWGNYIRRPSGNSEALRQKLAELLGQENFLTVYNKRGIGLCIQAVNATSGKPKVFKTPHNPRKFDDNDVTLVDAVMSSSAAPTYLPVRVLSPIPIRVYAEGSAFHGCTRSGSPLVAPEGAPVYFSLSLVPEWIGGG
jgi:patatin-like phospholipase/acyl hydrolase